MKGGFGVKAKLYTLQIILVELGGKGERQENRLSSLSVDNRILKV